MLQKPLLVAIAVLLLVSPLRAEAVSLAYRLEVINTWSTATHPGAFPSDAHFSWLGGGTHNDAVSFWTVGGTATPGVELMAETGVTSTLVAEVGAAVAAGTAFSSVEWRHWFCPAETVSANCGVTTVEFAVDERFPRLTLATMLGPSPDWFVGVSSLPLRAAGDWIPLIEVPLFPYDAGTVADNAFALGGTPSSAPISEITAATGQLIGGQALGVFRLTLIPEPATGAQLVLGLVVFALWRRRDARGGTA